MNCLRHFVLPVAVLCFSNSLRAQNDKRVIGDAVITPSEIAEGATVIYLIRFQNVSSDTVYQVIVRDTLDARLDLATFHMLDSSHPFQIVRDGSNIIRWYFNDISLPDSATGGPNSVGYVLFTVQPKPFLAPGQTILNRACFTFDQTFSICTNEAIIWTEADAADVGEPGKDRDIRVVPNPNHGQFEVQSTVLTSHPDRPAAEWWITDITGKIVWDGHAKDMAEASNQVLLERPSPGLYLLWVKDAKGLQVEEFAILR